MSNTDLQNKRILVTHADEFMGPAICNNLRQKQARVIADNHALGSEQEVQRVIQDAGKVDILIINLSITAPTSAATDVTESEWSTTFARLVDPLPRLSKAMLPQMIERQSGKIIIIGSAAAMRGMKRTSTYSAARGAQLAYTQALGVEVAKHNIQVNAIAQNFVDNATYFPPHVQADERFIARLQREVPLGRLVSAEEDAEFVAYLCSDAANCFVGQVFPVCGGWAH
ncbi:SDR family oxidoreductase [Ketobacter sp. MCCC 1A13808]|uniref:SDR family NAD(P)-dependent oxidoreductase n=1 Tax=Ketobacter sp. MCCC 1A13808 TaxID=2602738 RepID=UPI000F0FE3C4|nr:SDR family oxidoreductase [Ketobacter sp. MCCC 1A13808]MVF12374.1 SDR family oxidoreductase [Ketobacter sp. MCCC 1A13808]RLP55000.1 MAG: SDR family oxidoreductase [Ketobacter sp.]